MIVEGRIVAPDGVLAGRVRIVGDRIVAVEGDPHTTTTTDPAASDEPTGRRPAHWVVPGFVDMHTHGGGGHSFTAGDPTAARGAADFHLRHGTTTLLASLVSSPYDLMRAATAAYAPLVADGTIAGVHFEGPYLSRARRGAQHPAHLRDPSLDELRDLLAVGGGAVRMMTLAPERPHALAAIRTLVDSGVVAAVGHTDATFDQTRAAVATGATVATHLFNGMRPLHHREPGPILALLTAEAVTCELIADGGHLHDEVLAFAAGTAGAHRTALVTDAIDATGMPDGAYQLGGQAVTVTGGTARLATTDGTEGAIAGSTLTMDAALRRAVAAGIPLVDAATMAATTPARALGLSGEVGALAPGLRADLVVLDQRLRVQRVMRAGTWVTAAGE